MSTDRDVPLRGIAPIDRGARRADSTKRESAPAAREGTLINRREFLAGSIALAGQAKLLRSMGTTSIGGQEKPPASAPRNLLSTTFPESLLESKLVPADQWRPYPKWSDRGAWEAVPADIAGAIVKKAEADQKLGWKAFLASKFMEFKRDGNRSHYEADSFGRRAKLLHYVLAECMEGKGRFMDDIMNGVWLICEESFWGVPAHLGAQRAGIGLPDVTEPIIELFGAATAQLMAWTKYLVGEQLDKISPLIGKRIALETERRILKPARDRNDFWWMGLDGKHRRLNNWNPWINSNLMVANLILEEDPKRRVRETGRILKSLDQYLNQYWPDASEEEGPGYFNVSPLCYFEAVSMIDSATGNSTNILSNPFIDAMGRYILAAHVAGDSYYNYGDAHVHQAPDGDLLYRFGKAVHDPQLQAFGAWCAVRYGLSSTGTKLASALGRRLESMSRALPAVLAAREVRQAKREDALLRDAYYPDLGLATARLKAGSVEGMYFGDLAASNGRSHSHNDTGSYIIYLDGEPVAIDVGVPAYTRKTFSAERYTIWSLQSAYHNLPTIGGVMQHNGAEFKATDRTYSTNDSRATYSFNIAQAYPKEAGVERWVRTITLDRKLDRVVVEEDFRLEKAVAVSLSIMTPRRVATGSSVLTLNLASGEGRASLLKYDAAALAAHVETIKLEDKSLRDSWGPEIYRILLNSKQPVASGKWTYHFAPA